MKVGLAEHLVARARVDGHGVARGNDLHGFERGRDWHETHRRLGILSLAYAERLAAHTEANRAYLEGVAPERERTQGEAAERIRGARLDDVSGARGSAGCSAAQCDLCARDRPVVLSSTRPATATRPASRAATDGCAAAPRDSHTEDGRTQAGLRVHDAHTL